MDIHMEILVGPNQDKHAVSIDDGPRYIHEGATTDQCPLCVTLTMAVLEENL